MKKILLICLTLFLGKSVNSQTQLENPGFEGIWENVAGAEDEPLEWSSLKTADALTGLAPVVAFKEMVDPHSGTYCIKLENIASIIVANGLLTNGRVHADLVAANGYIYTIPASPEWNTPFTERADSLVGWFKYVPQGGDQGKVEVILHDDTQQGQLPATSYPMPHWIGRARYDVTATTASWVRFSVPFQYYNNTTPDYILVVLSAGDSTMAVAGSIMHIDDLELIYNNKTVVVTPAAVQNIDLATNGNVLSVTSTGNAAVIAPVTQEWKYSTTSGSGYLSFGVAETGTTYTPNFAVADIYYVICEASFTTNSGVEVIISNEVEIVVTDPLANSVTVSPSSPQTILLNENGALLTATENPGAASTREWKYTTTSGSGYLAFGTPVTGLTYTPNFSTLGTYFVICESDFSGDLQLSNEVTIIVPSAAGINEDNLKFNIFNNGNELVLNLSDIQENSTVSIYTLDGKQIYISIIDAVSTLHQVNADGVFIYRVVTGDKIITGKINL